MRLLRSTDGVTLALHDLGGSGRALLCSHATGFHAWCWAPVAERLRDRYHVWAVDYRGHGDATPPASGSFDWHGYGADAAVAAAAVSRDGLLAVGHSMGGAALLMAELDRPGTFAALVLFEPIVFPATRERGEGPPPLAEGARRRRTEFASREAAYANFAAKAPLNVFTPEALRAYVDHGFWDTETGTVRLKCEPEHEARTYEGSATHGTFERLGALQCPVLVLSGRTEPFQPSTWAADVAAAIPGAEFERLESVGHFGPMEDPDLVADRVAAFFARTG